MPVTTPPKSLVLSTLNAAYLHTCLALRSLQAFCRPRSSMEIRVMEFNINQRMVDILSAIYRQQPTVLAFSCYIWNIEPVLKVCADYKKAAPDTIIILGGPEVSFDPGRLLEQNPAVDFIVCGEGECVLARLLSALEGHLELASILGIAYRDDRHQIQVNAPSQPMTNLDDIPFAYANGADQLSDRLVYYESSRGCPFRCSYCLSGSSPGVRNLSLERVKSDLDILLALPVREIKFVDRTFNLDENRTRAIMEHILTASSQTMVHFEIDAGLFSDSMLDFLANVPAGRFNFEIGIQSTYPPALQAVGRRQDWKRLQCNITRLSAAGNIHIHLDLIAGLPGEDLSRFKESLDMTYALQPDMLQLGFLKILKGTRLESESDRLGYVYQSHPPYQVISTAVLDYGNMLTLMRMESLIKRYYNSGKMTAALAYITSTIYGDRAADFFQEFAAYWTIQGWWERSHKKEAFYTFLAAFIEHHHPAHRLQVAELLKYDYLLHNHRYSLPEGLATHNPADINQILYDYVRDKSFIHDYLPQWAGRPPRDIIKLLHLEFFRWPERQVTCREIKLMFVYDPITREAIYLLDLTGDVPCIWQEQTLQNRV